MSKKKSKVPKLTDKQYDEYIAALRNDASLYMPDGKEFVPEQIDVRKSDEKKGD